MKPEIRKVLVCSTSHVSRNVMVLLDLQNDDSIALSSVICSNVEYGWLVRYWPPALSECRTEAWRTIPRCLKDVIERAESIGCNMILFDRDADTLDGIRTYEW